MYFKSILLISCMLFLSSCVTEQRALLAEPTKNKATLVNSHIDLATGYIDLERYKIANEELQKALAIDPTSSRAYQVSAILGLRLGMTGQAIESMEQAYKYDPNNGAIAHELGVILCNSGQKQKGLEYFGVAMADQFFASRALSALRAGECIGNAQPNQARGYFDKALSIDPTLKVALYRTAEVLYLEGYPDQARVYFEKYMLNRIHSPETLLLGYRIETKASALPEARDYANELLRNFPTSPQAKKLTN